MKISLVGLDQTYPVYRGPRPECIEDWQQLRQAGVKTVLNLERGYFEFFTGRMNEEFKSAVATKLIPLHVQLGDIFPPSPGDLIRSVQAVKQGLTRGGVYIHCLHGVDRTGMVCALLKYDILKWHPDKCIQEMLDLGFHRFPYQIFGWVNQLKQVMRYQP